MTSNGPGQRRSSAVRCVLGWISAALVAGAGLGVGACTGPGGSAGIRAEATPTGGEALGGRRALSLPNAKALAEALSTSVGRAESTSAAELPSLPDSTRGRLVRRALSWLGWSKAFTVGGSRFRPDCSGFVEAVFAAEGIPLRDVAPAASEDRGSMVRAIHRAVGKLGTLFSSVSLSGPLPGDLVFWDDTYDRNHNRKLDDPLTHVGMVERVLEDGTVLFLHRGSRGVVRGRMSLTEPSRVLDDRGAELNAQVRAKRRHDPKGTRYFAGELFRAFGRFDGERLALALEESSARYDRSAVMRIAEDVPVRVLGSDLPARIPGS